ncbi:MAG: CoA transferase [Burkholderiaceae bacterium]|nr:CoA transferase [Burkholderiaceae bacterium]
MSAPPPLTGLKVIELHAIGPVPFAGMVLRQLGASVTRISPPNDPGLGVAMRPEHDLLNADKAAQFIDLKDPAGRAQLMSLLADADVLIEGFRPGVLERLGLAPAELLTSCPRLVIGRLSGWGSAGPLAARAGHDINYLALAGVLHAIGSRDAPEVPLNLIGDFGGGAMHLLLGVLSRLVARSISGAGGIAETSILAGTVGLTPMFYGMIAGGLWNLCRTSNLLDGAAPFYRIYRCADERFVALGAIEPKFYAELLDVLELSAELNPHRQYDPSSWAATTERIAARIAERTRDDWAERAASRDCCLSPVLDFAEAARHPHNRANGLFRDHPFAQPGATISFPH